MTTEEMLFAFQENESTQYHEAAHAVVDYIYGFHPKRITYSFYEGDRRYTSFLRSQNGVLKTPKAREKAQRFAVSCIAGIAAESKVSGVPIVDLRSTSGLDDYKKVQFVLERLMLHTVYEICPAVNDAYIQLWESRAVALINRPEVWSAVESLAGELMDCAGELGRNEIVTAIQHGVGSHAYLLPIACSDHFHGEHSPARSKHSP